MALGSNYYSGPSTIIYLTSNGSSSEVAWTSSLTGFVSETGIQVNDGGYLLAGRYGMVCILWGLQCSYGWMLWVTL
ncbi:MAG: hypothetical protein NWF00_07395 [Candidatus Bathyarchaeota archaeon]|nr:hypothetical protein [Candidatus Bathyarchaeota archaeon]